MLYIFRVVFFDFKNLVCVCVCVCVAERTALSAAGQSLSQEDYPIH
jgi:hypothetical protein